MCFDVLPKMRIIAIIAVIGLLPVSGCKSSSDEANHPDEVFPLYEDRVFQQDGVFSESKIDIALINQLEPWNEELLLRLFEPIAGRKIVYTYKSKYRIPEAPYFITFSAPQNLIWASKI